MGYGDGPYGAGIYGLGTVTPSLAVVKAYLVDKVTATDAQALSALGAEWQAQTNACTVPAVYPADLLEALCRRVAHNLALRGLPLGVQAVISAGGVATNYVAGLDAEVRRLEAPYRKRRTVLG